nr:MAG: ORF1 [TTV-like mini virus]
MPAYWNRFRNRRKRYRRRFWFPRRRTRKTFRRKWWRKRWTRRNKVKKRKFNRKKTKLILTQFQPRTINKCKIKGFKCLFQGSILRSNINYIQYIYSYVPEHWPGGGGWSLLVFSLSSLFEDYEHLQNIWTRSNAGLPLVRYLGCQFKFYQSNSTDYIVTYDNCWPMVDTPYTHADSAPSRMLQKKHKTVIPSRQTQKRKKPYKRVWVKPPSQMLNRWYFQKDLCNTPLVMLTATAVSLTDPFASPKAKNNNISVKVLSPYIFKNPNFQSLSTSGYSPKTDSSGNSLYLYASTHDNIQNLNYENLNKLIPLTDTKNYTPGKEFVKSTPTSPGNPFYSYYLHGETHTIYISNATPATIQNKINQGPGNLSESITKVTGPIIYTLRYNPENDTGSTNQCYFVSNSSAATFEPPENKNLIFEGFPLYILLWSWPDFIKKLKQTVKLDNNQILVLKTKTFDEKNFPYYIILDDDFIDGYDPYQEHTNSHPTTPSYYNTKNWYLKYEFQQQTLEKICTSGPGCARSTWNNYLQAYCTYKFYFKWGGCPKELQKAYNPCSQSKWPTPDNFNARLEITNPNRAPQTELYDWDWEKDYVKEPAIERIKTYTEIDQPSLSSAANRNNPAPLKKTQEKDNSEEEEEKELFIQLQHLRKQRLLLELHTKLQLTKHL